MKTTIVCGLLGAGKTTFIKQYIRNAEEKTVVLVNDFGKTGIDGEIFSAEGIESIELPSGCVCCTLKFDLISTIQEIIRTFAPIHLIIEPSGVASPSGVLEALDILNIEPVTVIGIVNATEFTDLYKSQMYGSFFEDQIINSDIILVNKTDLSEEKNIDETINLIEEINPMAVIFCTVNAELNKSMPDVARKHNLKKDWGHLHFDTISMRLKENTKLSTIKRFFEQMITGKYGTVVRAKALVQTDKGPYRFDLSYRHIHYTPFNQTIKESRLVVIGEKLKKDAILNYE